MFNVSEYIKYCANSKTSLKNTNFCRFIHHYKTLYNEHVSGVHYLIE